MGILETEDGQTNGETYKIPVLVLMESFMVLSDGGAKRKFSCSFLLSLMHEIFRVVFSGRFREEGERCIKRN